jgi:hypothetical protein
VEDALRPLGLIHSGPGTANQVDLVSSRAQAVQREKSGNAATHHHRLGIKPNPHGSILGLWRTVGQTQLKNSVRTGHLVRMTFLNSIFERKVS